MTDKLRELTLLALESHGCERLKDFYECGPVQRAAVETFLEAALAQQAAQAVPHLKKLLHAMHQEINAKHNLNVWLRASPAFAQRAAQAEAEWVVAVKHLVAVQMEAQKYVEESATPTPPAQQDAQAVAQPIGYARPFDLEALQNPMNPTVSLVVARDAFGFCTVPIYAAPTPPAQQSAQAVAQDHSDLYAQGWINGTQVQSLIDWCNSGCAKRADIAFTGGPSRQIAYAIEHLFKRVSNPETSEGVFVPRELLAKVANALGLPYEEEHTRLRSKLLDILSFAATAQRVMLTASEILGMAPESIPAEHDSALLEYARAVIEAYERKNGIK